MRNKRGLSGVIETVILILLVIGAIVILWAFVSSLINKNLEEMDASLNQINLKIKNVNSSNMQEVKVSVERLSGGEDMSGIRFVFSNGTDSSSIDEDIILNIFDMKAITFNITEELGFDVLEKVSIASIIITESGRKIIGNIVDEYKIN